jgi:hypothetical protein
MATNKATPLAQAATTASVETAPKFRVTLGAQHCQFTVSREWAQLIVDASMAHEVLANAPLVEAVFAPKSKTINFMVRLRLSDGTTDTVGFINYYKHGLVRRNLESEGAKVAAVVQEELHALHPAMVARAASRVDREAALAAILSK